MTDMLFSTVTRLAANLARLTNENDHTGAAIKLATTLKLRLSSLPDYDPRRGALDVISGMETTLLALQNKANRQGYLEHEEARMRDQMTRTMCHVYVKAVFDDAAYKAICEAL